MRTFRQFSVVLGFRLRNIPPHLVLAGVLALCVFPQTCLARTWTSKKGTFKVEAELLDASDTEVRLRKANNAEITVPLEKLSDKDKKYVESWRKQREKSGDKQPGGGKATGDKGKEQKLAPLDITIFDDELTMQAPVGAKADVDGVFPTVRFGKRFTMSIQPNTDNDLPDFKERFTNMPDAIAVEKVLLDEDQALAYKVNMKAFKAQVSVYMVVVTVGDKKYTCSDTSLEEMNNKEKLSAKDIELMIRCARTLTAKGATGKPTGAVPADDSADVPLVEFTLKPFVDELTVQAPEGTEVTDSTAKTRLRKAEDFDFEVNWTDSDSALDDFERTYSNTAIYTIKSVLVESPDTRAYEVIKKFPQPEKTACVFIVTKKLGENRYYCQSVTFGGYHKDDAVFNASAVKLMVRCAQSLKVK